MEHERVDTRLAASSEAAAVIRPRLLPFVSYPYEWCFSQLADAALLTLRAQEAAVAHGMTLRDATAYNVQYDGSRPILIDTLSFERLSADATWKPYRQFCEQFLAPLALMAYRGHELGELLRSNLDGIPLDVAARILPRRALLNPGLLAHLRLHARSQSRAGAAGGRANVKGSMGKTRLLALIDGLRRTVKSLRLPQRPTTWAAYTPQTSYSALAARSKEAHVRSLLDAHRAAVVLDIGANDGHYSAVAADGGRSVVAVDGDASAVERHYGTLRGSSSRVLPLLMDLRNPSPALGWNGEERASFLDRAHADTAMALAVIHHLAIGANLPFELISDFFSRIGKHLIVEFVPKSDPMTQRLLSTREDIFPNYTLEGLRDAFANDFHIDHVLPVEDSERVLLGMTRRD